MDTWSPEFKDLSHSSVSVFRCPLSHKAMPMTRKQDWWQQAPRRWRTWQDVSSNVALSCEWRGSSRNWK